MWKSDTDTEKGPNSKTESVWSGITDVSEIAEHLGSLQGRTPTPRRREASLDAPRLACTCQFEVMSETEASLDTTRLACTCHIKDMSESPRHHRSTFVSVCSVRRKLFIPEKKQPTAWKFVLEAVSLFAFNWPK
jgi:hypothetical protein